MNFIMETIKKIMKLFMYIFWLFPIERKKIFFSSHVGLTFNCNPYYIYKYLQQKSPNAKFIWLINNKSLSVEKDITTVKPRTLSFYYHILTAGTFITNDGIPAHLPFRKRQVMIETWHGGGAYKKSGADCNGKENSISCRIISNTYRKYTNYALSSSKKFSEVFMSAKGFSREQIQEIGMPRNDVFFNTAIVKSTNEIVRNKFNIDNDVFIVLYAPTYRGNIPSSVKHEIVLNIDLLISTIEKKFNKDVVVLNRFHEGQTGIRSNNTIDVSSYPNMQELLCAADMLITDYSSSMWDFSLTYKPGFLFTPDIEQYENKPGVYTPISEWPYPYAKTNEELCALIENYDETKAKQKIQAHLDKLGSFEDGHATQKICDIIIKRIEEK